jgi:hypothetical protein
MCFQIGIIKWKKNRKDYDDFRNRKLTLKVRFWQVLTKSYWQNKIFSFDILYPSLENSTIRYSAYFRAYLVSKYLKQIIDK